MAQAYGIAPTELADIPDDVMFEMVPGLREHDTQIKGQAAMEAGMETRLNQWRKDHPGGEPMPVL